jgi:FkbM family methyltransferase
VKSRKWLAPLRAPIEKMPIVADTFRLVRDYVKFRTSTPRELPLGFKLMGHPKMVSGHYELEETEIIGAELEHADVFVDVGANIGYYTCFARRRGKRVLAIEPSPTTLRFLYANLLANDIRDVEVIPVGLSDHVELTTLYGTGGTASLIPGWSRASSAYGTVIPTTTLDHLLAGRFADDRLFVKIDIEGAEYGMLRGAVKTMDRAIAPTWFVEIFLDGGKGYLNERFEPTFELFWQHGYTAHDAAIGGAIVTPADVGRWVAAGQAPSAGANYVFRRT